MRTKASQLGIAAVQAGRRNPAQKGLEISWLLQLAELPCWTNFMLARHLSEFDPRSPQCSLCYLTPPTSRLRRGACLNEHEQQRHMAEQLSFPNLRLGVIPKPNRQKKILRTKSCSPSSLKFFSADWSDAPLRRAIIYLSDLTASVFGSFIACRKFSSAISGSRPRHADRRGGRHQARPTAAQPIFEHLLTRLSP